MTFNWNNNVPASANDPSVDQPDMLENTQSNNSIWAVDHHGFDVANSGFHKQVRIKNQTPITGISQSGSLVTQDGAVPGTDTDLYYSPDASGTLYQLTTVSEAEKATFGTNPGWTFLPGGLIMQYDLVNISKVGIATVITYPRTFPTATFTITFGYVYTTADNSPSANNVFVKNGTVSTAGFTAVNSSSSTTRQAYYIAIGN